MAVPEALTLNSRNEIDPDLCFSFSELDENIHHVSSTADIQFYDFEEELDHNEVSVNTLEDPISEQGGKVFHSPNDAAVKMYEFEDDIESCVNDQEDSGIQVYDFEDENEDHVDTLEVPSQNKLTPDFLLSAPDQTKKYHNNDNIPSCAAVSETNEELRHSNGSNSKSTKISLHKCDICSFSSSKRYLIARHAKIHDDENELQYKCEICNRQFKHAATFYRHCKIHTGEKAHCCDLCSSEFASSGELVRHVKYKHTHEKAYQCTLCEYSAVEKAKVTRHMSCHTGERPYQCPDCSRAFPSIFNLKRHIRVHTEEKPFECDICFATFNQLNSLKTHRTIHTDENPVYECRICLSQFGRKCDLKNHEEKMHTSETPVHCEKCGDVFRDMYALKLHKKNHKRIACALCTFSCMTKRQLEKHSNKHTGLKPYKCDLCEACFKEKGQLRHHQILAHTNLKPHSVMKKTKPKKKDQRKKCQHCEKTFRSGAFLKRHMYLVKMSKKSNREKLKKDTALKLDKVIDEILGRGNEMTIQKNDEQVLDTDTEISPQFEPSEDLNKTVVYDFDSDIDDLPVEVTVDYANTPVDKKKLDMETCFGFNEYF